MTPYTPDNTTNTCPAGRARWRTRVSLAAAVFTSAGAAMLAGTLGGCAASSDTPAAEYEGEAAMIERATSLVREAQRYELAGDAKKAVSKYQEAIGSYRELPVAWNNMGRLLMLQGENLQAADAFKTASELSPTDPRPMFNLGALWEDLGYLDDAARWYDQALERDGKYLPALRRRVLVDQLRDRYGAETSDRIRTAVLIEKDPWWLDRFRSAELRCKQAEAAKPSAAIR